MAINKLYLQQLMDKKARAVLNAKKDSVNTRTNGTCALCSDSNTNLEASALNPVAQPNPVLLVRTQLNIPVLCSNPACWLVVCR